MFSKEQVFINNKKKRMRVHRGCCWAKEEAEEGEREVVVVVQDGVTPVTSPGYALQ